MSSLEFVMISLVLSAGWFISGLGVGYLWKEAKSHVPTLYRVRR